MKGLIGQSSKVHLPMWIDNVHADRQLRMLHSFVDSSIFSAVVIGLVGVMKIANSGSKNTAALSPLPPALQSLLGQSVHARFVDIRQSSSIPPWPLIALASPASRSPTSRGASTTGWSSSDLDEAITPLWPM